MNLEAIHEWIAELDERLCGYGTILILHPDTGLPMKHTMQPEYIEVSFTGNTRATTIAAVNEWQAIDIAPTTVEISGFDADPINGGYVYTGTCEVRPRHLMASIAVEAAGNNQTLEFAFFKDSGDGPEIIQATDVLHELRFGGTIENIITQSIITLEAGDRLMLMFRNITSTTEVTFETVQKTLI